MAHSFSLLLSLFVLVSATAACPASDRAALMALRSALSEPYLGIFSSWTGHDCCSRWYGVSCDPDTGHVADITLRGESEDPILVHDGRSGGIMSGRISPRSATSTVSPPSSSPTGSRSPAPSLPASPPFPSSTFSTSSATASPVPSLLTSAASPSSTSPTTRSPARSLHPSPLSPLYAPRSQQQPALSSQITPNFGDLRMLNRALLSRNQISSPIPTLIGSMARLADLDLAGNRISSYIPTALGSMPVLSLLYLDGNQISGQISCRAQAREPC